MLAGEQSNELLKLSAELLQMRIKSGNCCPVLCSCCPARNHHRIKLVGAVDGLVESEPVNKVSLHLKRINVWERLLGPCQNLPHSDTPAPNVSTGREVSTLKCIEGEPLDRPVVV